MSKKFRVIAAAAGLAAGLAYGRYPIMNVVADKVVRKYQSSSCEQRWESKGRHGPEEQRVIGLLDGDQQMREAFFNRIAGPVMNKMFQCGMIP